MLICLSCNSCKIKIKKEGLCIATTRLGHNSMTCVSLQICLFYNKIINKRCSNTLICSLSWMKTFLCKSLTWLSIIIKWIICDFSDVHTYVVVVIARRPWYCKRNCIWCPVEIYRYFINKLVLLKYHTTICLQLNIIKKVQANSMYTEIHAHTRATLLWNSLLFNLEVWLQNLLPVSCN